MSDKEIFVDIKGYEGLYQISNKGNVRSLLFRNKQCALPRIRAIKPFTNDRGYQSVALYKAGTQKRACVHRLVAEAFIPNDERKSVVNHLDYDPSNNKVENLEWCTQRENVLYSAARMRHEKKKCRASNTGEKYISKYYGHGKLLRYRVYISSKNICRQFKTLQNAIDYRNEVMKDER